MFSKENKSDKGTRSKTCSDSQTLISQSAVQAKKETHGNKRKTQYQEGALKLLMQIHKPMLMLIVVVLGFVLSLYKIDSPLFSQIVWMVGGYCGIEGSVRKIAEHFSKPQ